VRSRKAQQGLTLIVMMTVIVMGLAWYIVGALGKAAPTTADKEIRTGAALHAAKQALLTYVANYAAQTVPLGNPETMLPGRLPCPEPLSPAAGGEGIAAGCASNVTTYIGRLPWRTLGVDQIRDGDGELLWYVLGPGFRQAPINFGTAGQLTVDVGASPVVALIIAPGRPINTASEPGPPPAACPAVGNQYTNRYATPFDPAKFLECGRGNAVTSHTLVTPSPWTNDRVISVTAAEVMEAISGPVADRLQRQVAPAMNDYRTTISLASWGESFLPDASTFDSMGNSPPSNDLCGNDNTRAGMPPTATVAAGTCGTNWASGSASSLPGLLEFGACISGANDMRCDFTVILGGFYTPRITATAPRIARSFRSFDPSTIEISRNGGATWQSAPVQNYSGDVSGGPSGNATIQFDVVFPLLTIVDSVVVRLPHPTDALLPDARVSWFLNNNWDRFTYYAVTRAATTAPGGAVCNPGGVVTDCLAVTGMPAPANDKRLVLALMGRAPIPPAAWPSANPADYLEGENGSPTDRTFEIKTVNTAFNDRVAACPFQYTPQTGPPISICN
jgi:hypothetical protein